MDAGDFRWFLFQDALANPKLPSAFSKSILRATKGEPQAPEIHRIPRSERHPYLFRQADEG